MQLDERTVEKAANIHRPLLRVEVEADSHLTTDQLVYDARQDPCEQAHLGLLRQHLCQLMISLDDRECQVVSMRYGWDGQGKRTLLEISGLLGVSRARVSQIEQTALKKLRKQWKLSASPLSL